MTAIICSPPMQQLMELVQKAARTNAAVLITGESGSGKEVIARSIHHYSLRCNKPWVDVSCGALPEHLLESELFGYEKGAFSGANVPKPGLFELAHTGTLLLDEIGELEPRMQVKLLRVLDGAPYYRLGGVRKVTVDTRIVAATNQDLEQAIQCGKFRSDLYHRLNQLQIRVPPLRERPDAIIPLAEFFLRQIDPKRHFSDNALVRLHSYSWPGNIRELRNIVTQAAAFSDGEIIHRTGLPEEAQQVAMMGPVSRPQSLNLNTMERRMIEEAVHATGGNYQEASQMLGISRRTLSRKMKLYEIQGFEQCEEALPV